MKLFFEIQNQYLNMFSKILEKASRCTKSSDVYFSISNETLTLYLRESEEDKNIDDIGLMTFFNLEELCSEKVIQISPSKTSINFVMTIFDFKDLVLLFRDKLEFESVCFTLSKNNENKKILKIFFVNPNLLSSNEIIIGFLPEKIMPNFSPIILKGYFESKYFLSLIKNLIQNESNLRLRIRHILKTEEEKEEEEEEEEREINMIIFFSDENDVHTVSLPIKNVFELDENWVKNKFDFETIIHLNQLKRLYSVFQVDPTNKYIISVTLDKKIHFQVYNTKISNANQANVNVTIIESLYSLDSLIFE